MTWARQEFLDRISRANWESLEYADDVLVRLAHNSAAIEGNSLTVSETITLLVDELSPGAGREMREVFEVANHREALAIIAQAANTDPLDQGLVKQLHSALMDHLVPDKGQYKTGDNLVRGASWNPVPPSRVPSKMMEWANQIEWQLDNLDDDALIEAIAASHIRFERIHPFSDGNGRTGRAILAYQGLRCYGAPIIIPVARKSDYIDLLDADNQVGFADMIAEVLAEEIDRKTRFQPATRLDVTMDTVRSAGLDGDLGTSLKGPTEDLETSGIERGL